MGYKNSAFKSISWMGLLRILTRLIAFVRLGILARILTPSQFGVFGIATLLLSFLETITETGINVFLIQRKEKIDQFINAAWLVSIIRGILISTIIIFTAPLVVKFFNSPESLKVILLISLVPFIRGFINPSIVSIHKDIQFHKEFWLRITLFSVDAVVAVTVALITKSAVSMAIGLIISATLELILSYVLFKPFPKLKLEIDKVKYIISKSWWVTVSGIFDYGGENGDDIVVGRVLGTSSLGIYQAAYKISTLPIRELTEVISKVVFPVYSKFSDDKGRLIKAFKKVFSVTSLIALGLGSTIFIFAEQIVMIILGDQWVAAVPIVKILAVYGVIRTITGNFMPLYFSVGRQDYYAKTTFLRFFGLIVTIIPFVHIFGLEGAAYAAIVSVLIEAPLSLLFAYRIIRAS